MTTRRTTALMGVIALLLLVNLPSNTYGQAAPADAAKASAAPADEVLKLKLEIETLKDALQQTNESLSACDINWASVRRELNAIRLTESKTQLEKDRAGLKASISAAGLEVVDEIDAAGVKQGRTLKKKADAAPAGKADAKKP